MANPLIILFARAPRLGCVKRRLAAGIGQIAALRFYRNQLGRILRELRPFDTILALTPDRTRFRPAPKIPIIPQGQGDLGTRMQNAFAKFRRRSVILIGADIPDLNAAILRTTIRGLRAHDAVFGPAADGGYYLIALSPRRPSTPFANVRWSTEHALTDTLKNFPPRHRIAFLPTLTDIDTQENLKIHRIIRHCSPTRKPLTLGVVAESVSNLNP